MRLSSESRSGPVSRTGAPGPAPVWLDARGTVRLCSRGLGSLRMVSCLQLAATEAHAGPPHAPRDSLSPGLAAQRPGPPRAPDSLVI